MQLFQTLLITVLAVQFTVTAAVAKKKQVHSEMVEVLRAYGVHKMGQYDEAFDAWMALAIKGNAQGILNVANFYAEGKGVDRDLKKAAQWYRKGADQGDPHCLYRIALAYDQGVGVDADPNKAAQYYELAASGGATDAQIHLATALIEAGDIDKARYWLQRAADRGDQKARAMRDKLGGSSNETGANDITDERRIRIHRFLNDLDAAANARDADWLTKAIAPDANIFVRLPGQAAAEPMSKNILRTLWQSTFDKTDRYRFTRAKFDMSEASGLVRIRSKIREYLTSNYARTQVLLLEETLHVDLVSDKPTIKSLSLIVEKQ